MGCSGVVYSEVSRFPEGHSNCRMCFAVLSSGSDWFCGPKDRNGVWKYHRGEKMGLAGWTMKFYEEMEAAGQCKRPLVKMPPIPVPPQ